jgi:RNA polymerase sigma factor (sigma-70 family)
VVRTRRENLVPITRARAARAIAAGAAPGPLYDAYVRLAPALGKFLQRRTGSNEVAQDLLQDVWLHVAEARAAEEIGNPDAFLQRVAGNLALDWLRKHSFRSSFHDEDADMNGIMSSAPDAERVYQSRRTLDYLRIVIDELPAGRRKAFLLCRGEGLTAREAGRSLGIAEKTVKHQLAAATAHIRERLVQAGLWP